MGIRWRRWLLTAAPGGCPSLPLLAGPLPVADGTRFTFSDDIGFGTYMRVTFSDSQITLTNLIPGIFPEYTAADFEFRSGPALASGRSTRRARPASRPAASLEASSYDIHLNSSNTVA